LYLFDGLKYKKIFILKGNGDSSLKFIEDYYKSAKNSGLTAQEFKP
jgi:hypothetical protein